MSIQAIAHVWKNSLQTGGNLLVHLALADYSDDEGFSFPSINSLKDKSRMSERSVQYAIRDMIATGELAIVAEGGILPGVGRRANCYQLNMHGRPRTTTDNGEQSKGAKIAPLPEGCKMEPGRVQNTTLQGATHCTPTVIDPSLIRQEGAEDDFDLPPPKEPTSSIQSKKDGPQLEIDFNAFWAAYPNKKGKPQAFKVFKRFKKEFAAIMAGLAKHAKSEQWKKDAGYYIPHPATFLSQERWKDEPSQKPAKTHPSTNRPSASNAGTANATVASRYK